MIEDNCCPSPPPPSHLSPVIPHSLFHCTILHTTQRPYTFYTLTTPKPFTKKQLLALHPYPLSCIPRPLFPSLTLLTHPNTLTSSTFSLQPFHHYLLLSLSLSLVTFQHNFSFFLAPLYDRPLCMPLHSCPFFHILFTSIPFPDTFHPTMCLHPQSVLPYTYSLSCLLLPLIILSIYAYIN